MQSQSRALVVTIIVLLVAGGAFVLFGSPRAPIEHSAALDPPQVEPFEAPDDWLTYVNRPGCFSIQYPPDAQVVDSFLDGPPLTGDGFTVSVTLPDAEGLFSGGAIFDLYEIDPMSQYVDLSEAQDPDSFLYAHARRMWEINAGYPKSRLVQVSVGNTQGYAFSIEGGLTHLFNSGQTGFSGSSDLEKTRTVILVGQGDFIAEILHFMDDDIRDIIQTFRFLNCNGV